MDGYFVVCRALVTDVWVRSVGAGRVEGFAGLVLDRRRRKRQGLVERSQEWVGETHVADIDTVMTTLLTRRPLVEH